jgi:modulator of FtsH protease HflC
MKLKIITFAIAILFLGVYASAYTVDETEQVLVTRFDKVNRSATAPGLYFKLPLIEKAISYPRNLQEWDGDPGQIPTKEKTYIWVDTFARWKIVDPIVFFKTIGFVERAQNRLDEIIDPAVRNFITSSRLIDAVRNSNRELDTFEEVEGEDAQAHKAYDVTTGREEINRGILLQAQPKLSNFGIELEDVKIKRINYVEEVRKSVYGRMIAERRQIAEKFKSEGKGEARKILGEKERILKKITSEAYKTAQEIKGKADAEATRLYAKAFGVDPEFYSFQKTLDIYSQTLDKESSVVVSTESEFFKYLDGYEK